MTTIKDWDDKDHWDDLLASMNREARRPDGTFDPEVTTELLTQTLDVLGYDLGAPKPEPPKLPVVRLTVPGLPDRCPHCHLPIAFNLTEFGGQLRASCPSCFQSVAVVTVVSG